MQRESVAQSVLVAACLCLVCSLLVSSAAVLLRPKQQANKQRQMQKDVLQVAGLYQEGADVAESFQKVDMRIVDLETGQFVDPDSVQRDAYDPKVAPKEPDYSIAIEQDEDLAGLKRRERLSAVYFVKSPAGELQQVILPVRGKGLWSTMYGFVSLESDFRTVRGITFYEHGETPGLGGEIESPKFKRQWQGKVVRDEDGSPHIEAVRGSVDPQDPEADHKVDAIAGATITTRGVTDMIRYWLGPNGFGPFLERMAGTSVAESSAPADRRPAVPGRRTSRTAEGRQAEGVGRWL
jgi:Na+-transporting NADH:ubiquinone oxidoreductase subunit C